LGITDRFAINIKDSKLVFEKISDTETLTRISNDFTRIDDNTIEMNNTNLNKLSECYYVVAVSVTSDGRSNILVGNAIFNGGNNSIFVGTALKGKPSSTNKYPNNIQCFGLGNKVSNSCEFASGCYNITNNKTVGNYQYNTVFSIGAGSLSNGNLNALELISKKNITDNTSINALYVNGVGGYDGTNVSDDNTKSLQQVISDIETAVSLNSNGPWDVDITSEFVNGNVTIKPLSMWSISQGVKRVYFEADLKQGDVITIPDSLRMYIGWKISDNRFGMADWNTAAKKYTITTDSHYVILIATANDNPGVQINNLPSFGKVMLRTSNPEFKPTAQTDAKKDHTNDDKVMRGIAHQGFHKLERANSLAAFRAAAKEGWRYVETDTYMTTDGKFIVSHDPYLPTGWTNGTVTTTQGSYKYEEHTLAEILAFHGPNNEKTDTLEEFCKTCKECGLHPYIELKQGKMADTNTLDTNPRYNGKGYGVKVLDIVNRYGLRGNATFIASVPFTLLRMAREDQSYRYGIVYFGQLKNSDAAWATVLSKIDEYNNDAVASKAYLFLDANINNLKVADADAVDKLV
jgi:glycerophosphodiester phosphodiesterase